MLPEPLVDAKLYLCNATNEQEARRILEDHRARFVEREFTVRRWLVAL